MKWIPSFSRFVDFRICVALLAIRPSSCRVPSQTPVCVGQGSASGLTAWRSTSCGAPGHRHQHCCRQTLFARKCCRYEEVVFWFHVLTSLATHFFHFSFTVTEQYWLFNLAFRWTWNQKLTPWFEVAHITGFMLLVFMSTHSFQRRFSSTPAFAVALR